jgi:ABC-2 type transport system permease protein
MSRFIWLVRREVWEHKAIWVAPLIVLACLLLAVITGNVHLGPFGATDVSTPFGALPAEKQIKLLLVVYVGLAFVVYMVMGVIAFFYALDSLYADRRDRSVLFWKSLPLSDAETVLSKFTIVVVVIPLVALVGALLAQLTVAGGASAMLAVSGVPGAIMWQHDAILGAVTAVFVACGTAMLWYAPLAAYLLLASAWAPKGPFLWAVLPPVALSVLERVVLGSSNIGNFIAGRIKGPMRILESGMQTDGGDTTIRLSQLDVAGGLEAFYSSPDLWLGLVAAALLLAAAIWVRRYRDETI